MKQRPRRVRRRAPKAAAPPPKRRAGQESRAENRRAKSADRLDRQQLHRLLEAERRRARRAEERLRAVSRAMVMAHEEEQRRVSGELHDYIGQSLAAISLNLKLIGDLIPPDAAPEARERLAESQELLTSAIDFSRDLVSRLRPPAMDDYGLLAGLRWYVAQVQKRSRMSIRLEGNEPVPRLTRQRERALFRIAQEAVTNALQHSGAKSLTVLLHDNGNMVTLSITDDGIGGDLNAVHEDHWGLLLMRERAEAVGARLSVRSGPGEGTSIVVKVSRAS